MGFEPTIGFPLCSVSNRVLSASQPRLRRVVFNRGAGRGQVGNYRSIDFWRLVSSLRAARLKPSSRRAGRRTAQPRNSIALSIVMIWMSCAGTNPGILAFERRSALVLRQLSSVRQFYPQKWHPERPSDKRSPSDHKASDGGRWVSAIGATRSGGRPSCHCRPRRTGSPTGWWPQICLCGPPRQRPLQPRRSKARCRQTPRCAAGSAPARPLNSTS